MQSSTVATDEALSVLDDLLQNARDGEYGFKACADEVDDPALKQTFQNRAAECAEAAAQLVSVIRALGGEADDGGSMTGALHRGWVHVKGAVGADSAISMLEECERGEDAAAARYRKALKSELPIPALAVVERQAAGAARNHDQIKALRDEYKRKE